MNKIVCLRHPTYDGVANPDLLCTSCCTIFVQKIKLANAKRAVEVATWLESKGQKIQAPHHP